MRLTAASTASSLISSHSGAVSDDRCEPGPDRAEYEEALLAPTGLGVGLRPLLEFGLLFGRDWLDELQEISVSAAGWYVRAAC